MFLCCDSKRYNAEFGASKGLKLKSTVSYISSFPILDCSSMCGATWYGLDTMDAASAPNRSDQEGGVSFRHIFSGAELAGSCRRQSYMESFTMHKRANFSAFHFLEQSVYKITKWEDKKYISGIYLFSRKYSEDYDKGEINVLRSFQAPCSIPTQKRDSVQWLNQDQNFSIWVQTYTCWSCWCSVQLLAGFIARGVESLRRSKVLSLHKRGKSPEIFIFGAPMMPQIYSFLGRNGARNVKSLRPVHEYSQDNGSCCQAVAFSVVPGCKGRTGQLNMGIWTQQDSSKIAPHCLISSLWSESYFSGDDEHLQNLLTPVETQIETIFGVSSFASKIVHIEVSSWRSRSWISRHTSKHLA